MTRVHIASTDESRQIDSAGGMNAHEYLMQAIQRSIDDYIALTDNPSDADLIIFAESHKDPKPGEADASTRVRRHPIYREFTSKCVIHNGADRPNPVVPGLYPSIPHQWAKRLCCVGAPYLAHLNPYIDEALPDDREPALIAGFMGSCARKPLRQKLLHLSKEGDWERIEYLDTTAQFVGSLRNKDAEGHAELKRLFVQQILNSRFVLCPAGAGSSSYRLFEAMRCGRAPVIISDCWTPPPGPSWESFAIIVHPAKARALPAILNAAEDRWKELGIQARTQWERHYHPDVLGREFVGLARQVLDMQPHERTMRRIVARAYIAGPMFTERISSKLRRRISRG